MKALIKGVWHAGIADTPALRLARAEEKKRYFRDKVTADGSSGFAAAKGRYHLYVSYACPWAHRAILYRALKGLEDVVPMSVAHPSWGGPDGWTFGDTPMSTIDHAGGFDFLYQAYQAAKPNFTGKVTVPALWDKERKTIVNNESGEIIRMLNSEFDAWGDASVDFYPENLRGEIDSLNAVILDSVCNGVYKAGFASEQADYDRAVKELFDTMDDLEERLAAGPYLHGERVTESDWHLLRPWRASMPSITAASNAISGVSSTTRASTPIRAGSTNCRGLPRRSSSSTSSAITTTTSASTTRASFPPVRPWISAARHRPRRRLYRRVARWLGKSFLSEARISPI